SSSGVADRSEASGAMLTSFSTGGAVGLGSGASERRGGVAIGRSAGATPSEGPVFVLNSAATGRRSGAPCQPSRAQPPAAVTARATEAAISHLVRRLSGRGRDAITKRLSRLRPG